MIISLLRPLAVCTYLACDAGTTRSQGASQPPSTIQLPQQCQLRMLPVTHSLIGAKAIDKSGLPISDDRHLTTYNRHKTHPKEGVGGTRHAGDKHLGKYNISGSMSRRMQELFCQPVFVEGMREYTT